MKEWLNDILLDAVMKKASDVHFSVGSPVFFRLDGEIVLASDEILTQEKMKSLRKEIVPKNQLVDEDSIRDYDFSYEIPEISRFRMNFYTQRKGLSLAVRVIPMTTAKMADLGLPPELKKIAQLKNGIFLVTGPTGSGKSTSLSSIIHYLNGNFSRRIITLEDPVEFVYENKKSIIEQRELGGTVESFEKGIRGALRQDPDVILVGEMRDLETISAAITAAETGHLVFSTLHTNDAPKTIDRIIDAFPSEQQPQVRNQIASLLRGVLTQQLVKRADGPGRVVVTEFLLNNSAVANLIRTDKIHQIHNVMLTGMREGMHTMDTKMKELINLGVIEKPNTAEEKETH